MEDPRYSTLSDEQVNGFNLALDPTLTTFQFPQLTGLTPLPPNMPVNYTVYPPDAFSHSYTLNMPTFNPNDHLFDGVPRSSHDDLNQFFNDASFGGNTPGVGTPGAGSRFIGGDQAQEPLGASWLRHRQQHTPEDDSQNTAGLAIDTSSQNMEQRETLVQNGQVTPGDSPGSPKFQKGQSTTTRKTGRKTRASAKAEPAVTAAADGAGATAPAPAKKTRKPRKSSKKVRTPEQEAQKRETFLKRNREAAYKCRIKKKNQTEGIVERAKMLDQDNAMKALQVEQLKREVEGLRAMLLPHWRACQDATVSSYVDKLVNEGWELGKMVIGAMIQREVFDAGEEPREDDGLNDEPTQFGETAEQTQYGGSPKSTHPRNEDDDETMEPTHKRRCSEAIFELSINDFEASMSSMDGNRQRRESFFGSSLNPEEAFKDALGGGDDFAGSNSSSSGSATPLARGNMAGMEFLVGQTPPPLDLSAPDGL